MTAYFDALETRSADERAADIATRLPELIAHAKTRSSHYANSLSETDPADITHAVSE